MWRNGVPRRVSLMRSPLLFWRRQRFGPCNGTAALLMVLSLAASVAAHTGCIHAAANAAAAGFPTIAIDNLGQVNTTYYRGGQPEGRDYAALATLGIRTVIDLQKDGDSDEARSVAEAGMQFVRIPMTTHAPPTLKQISLFLRIVNDPARRPVYVHCAAGRHRTGVMTAVYRMERDGWTADQAYTEMKQYKFGWDFLHPEFKSFVYRYRPGLAAKTRGPGVAVRKSPE
jgi:protein-tyrosine phosphatase